ncbi:hypothetical protein B0H17DRAFT_1155238 [Mycena rosella]|uniref:Uncharacterized protein n=1 Tax=Mycena rosella TaxID=1033263 RepID=A0AAD7AWK1_MYCRO|nr:hypothetical protein B0H17DRAFT_1155238 [Mycena rosella]
MSFHHDQTTTGPSAGLDQAGRMKLRLPEVAKRGFNKPLPADAEDQAIQVIGVKQRLRLARKCSEGDSRISEPPDGTETGRVCPFDTRRNDAVPAAGTACSLSISFRLNRPQIALDRAVNLQILIEREKRRDILRHVYSAHIGCGRLQINGFGRTQMVLSGLGSGVRSGYYFNQMSGPSLNLTTLEMHFYMGKSATIFFSDDSNTAYPGRAKQTIMLDGFPRNGILFFFESVAVNLLVLGTGTEESSSRVYLSHRKDGLVKQGSGLLPAHRRLPHMNI